MGLDRCSSCNRHVRADASACPFCRATRARSPRASALATGLTALALAGCPSDPPPAPVYGAPPSPSPARSTDSEPPAPIYGAPPPPPAATTEPGPTSQPSEGR